MPLDEKNLNFTKINKVLYFYKGLKIYFYIVINEEAKLIHREYHYYESNSYRIKEEEKWINILNKFNIPVIPLLWIHSPMSWICGITVGRFNDTQDIITIAGNKKELCLYIGLDCNEHTNSLISAIKNIDFENIFNLKLDSFNKNRIMSTYQIYIINKNITLNRGYGFIPWSEGNFIESAIYYSFDLLEIKKEINLFFKKYNYANKVTKNKKVCYEKSNNP